VNSLHSSVCSVSEQASQATSCCLDTDGHILQRSRCSCRSWLERCALPTRCQGMQTYSSWLQRPHSSSLSVPIPLPDGASELFRRVDSSAFREKDGPPVLTSITRAGLSDNFRACFGDRLLNLGTDFAHLLAHFHPVHVRLHYLWLSVALAHWGNRRAALFAFHRMGQVCPAPLHSSTLSADSSSELRGLSIVSASTEPVLTKHTLSHYQLHDHESHGM